MYDSTLNSIQQYAYYNGSWVMAGGIYTPSVVSSSGCPYGFIEIPNIENIDGAVKDGAFKSIYQHLII